MGATRFALSPEDGFANARTLWSEFGDQAVLIVYQDTPQFLAESCAYANLIGGCPGKANCRFESMEMVSSHGERVTAIDYHCRTIVLNQGPFCLSTRLPDWRRPARFRCGPTFCIARTSRRWCASAGVKFAAGGRFRAAPRPISIAGFCEHQCATSELA